MEDIGNLLYYIVIFVIAIVSWISSSGKKKQQQTSIPSPFPTQQETFTMPAPVSEKKRKTPPPAPRNTRQMPFAQSTLSSKYTDNTPIQVEDNSNPIIDDLDLDNAESFRRAIIYAEIFNRKSW